MPSLVTLVYTATTAPGAKTSVQKTAVESYTPDADVLNLLGLAPDTDSTSTTATTIVRTIVLHVHAKFVAQFPTTASQLGAVANLFVNDIARASRLSVVASAPVFT